MYPTFRAVTGRRARVVRRHRLAAPGGRGGPRRSDQRSRRLLLGHARRGLVSARHRGGAGIQQPVRSCSSPAGTSASSIVAPSRRFSDSARRTGSSSPTVTRSRFSSDAGRQGASRSPAHRERRAPEVSVRAGHARDEAGPAWPATCRRHDPRRSVARGTRSSHLRAVRRLRGAALDRPTDRAFLRALPEVCLLRSEGDRRKPLIQRAPSGARLLL